jgi:hypothetical protein
MHRRRFITSLGAAITAARNVRAQQKTMPVIGYLNGTNPDANAVQLAAFRQGLSETGWVEGQNLKIEYRWAEFHFDRLPGLAADLVTRKVNVLVACGGVDEAFVAKMRLRPFRPSSRPAPTRSRAGSWPASRGPAAVALVSLTSTSCYGKSGSS